MRTRQIGYTPRRLLLRARSRSITGGVVLSRGSRMALTGLSGLLALAAASHGVAAQNGSDAPFDRIGADITLTRALVGAAHEVAAPPVTYRVTHTRHGAGWKTVYEVRGRELPLVQGEDGPERLRDRSRVARLEDDGDGSPVRVYDYSGALIRAPQLGDPTVLGGLRNARLPAQPRRVAAAGARPPAPADFEPLLLSKSQSSARRAVLQRSLGRVLDRIGGRDRYVRQRGDYVEEVLTDPDWAVPLELNIVRRGRLIAHTVMTYRAGPGGSLVSETVRAERALDGARPGRSVTTVTFSNVVAERGR